ncbi:MAG: hypothetical protein M3S32_08650 [Acidobacteriota bacterium]|nr:hypothetical protein [Acidobacteriota bacterium]
MRKIALVVVFGTACAAAGCGRDAPADRLARAAESTARLALPTAFRPPPDGTLTGAQVDLYVKVRRAAKGRTDAEASRAVGVDPDEFAWVRSRIVEGLLEADRRRVRAASEVVYGKTIASLRETRRAVRDAATARTVDEQIAGLERERVQLRRPEAVPPALAANARLVAARRSEIDGPP